jgi:hypothetical protein
MSGGKSSAVVPELPAQLHEIDGRTSDGHLHLPAGLFHLDGAFNRGEGGEFDKGRSSFLMDGGGGITSRTYLQFVIVRLEAFSDRVDGVVRTRWTDCSQSAGGMGSRRPFRFRHAWNSFELLPGQILFPPRQVPLLGLPFIIISETDGTVP